MGSVAVLERARLEGWSDEEVVARVVDGDTAMFEILMRRHNQRLYRVARAILRDDTEAEDVMQDAYVRAYQHLHQFEGRAKFSTWLTRICVHEALARAERRGRFEPIADDLDMDGGPMGYVPSNDRTPEQQASNRELGDLLEKAILGLPETYRTVLIMRDVEEMNTAETAEVLGITEENVKVRLHRARMLLRDELYSMAGASSSAAFAFHAPRCDRVVKNVFARINEAA
jgi:RNA polymerase sigma-70 factor (ECF subfamily)